MMAHGQEAPIAGGQHYQKRRALGGYLGAQLGRQRRPVHQRGGSPAGTLTLHTGLYAEPTC